MPTRMDAVPGTSFVSFVGSKRVAQGLGPLDDKIVIDISFPHQQAADGYYEPMLETSSAEMIQQWNPRARVMKTFALQASYVIDDPGCRCRFVG